MATDRQRVIVSLTGARLAFGGRVLWDHLDLSVSPGEFIAVLGPHGTGKTSLLRYPARCSCSAQVPRRMLI